ncbi:MAG: hypothetical protein IKC04_04265 [Oscillospiraceae bacterium]|nr:hypothetical protein [Oscillospiraceae bacterium]
MSKDNTIEFCGNCGLGAITHRDYPGSCDYYAPGTKKRCNSWTKAKGTGRERVVYICSPLRGDIEGNLRRAAAYSRAAVESNAIPITPHLYFASFLDDTKHADRKVGMQMGIELLKKCDELWVFGKPSEGMAAEITEAGRLQKPIIYVPEETVRELNERSTTNNG